MLLGRGVSLKWNLSENVISISNFRTRKSKPRQTKKLPILDEINFKEEIPEDLTDAILDEHEEIDDEDKPLKPKKKRKPRAKPAPGKCCTNRRIFPFVFEKCYETLRCSLDHVSLADIKKFHFVKLTGIWQIFPFINITSKKDINFEKSLQKH